MEALLLFPAGEVVPCIYPSHPLHYPSGGNVFNTRYVREKGEGGRGGRGGEGREGTSEGGARERSEGRGARGEKRGDRSEGRWGGKKAGRNERKVREGGEVGRRRRDVRMYTNIISSGLCL